MNSQFLLGPQAPFVKSLQSFQGNLHRTGVAREIRPRGFAFENGGGTDFGFGDKAFGILAFIALKAIRN